jgi:hypothetical protein
LRNGKGVFIMQMASSGIAKPGPKTRLCGKEHLKTHRLCL